jgi:hypothetical protein
MFFYKRYSVRKRESFNGYEISEEKKRNKRKFSVAVLTSFRIISISMSINSSPPLL